MTEHSIKTETEYFEAVRLKLKTFELRKDDRDYKRGDTVHLIEVAQGKPTGRSQTLKKITYVLRGPLYGLEEGYCIFNW